MPVYKRPDVTGSWKFDALLKGFLDRNRELNDQNAERYARMQENMVKMQQERWKSAITKYDEDQRVYNTLRNMRLDTDGGRTVAAIQAARLAGADPNDSHYAQIVRQFQKTIDDGGWEGYINQFNYNRPVLETFNDPQWARRQALKEDPILGPISKHFGHRTRGRSYAYHYDNVDQMSTQAAQQRAETAKEELIQKYSTTPYTDLPGKPKKYVEKYNAERRNAIAANLTNMFAARGYDPKAYREALTDSKGREYFAMTGAGQYAQDQHMKHIDYWMSEMEQTGSEEQFVSARLKAEQYGSKRLVGVDEQRSMADKVLGPLKTYKKVPVLYIPPQSLPFSMQANAQDRAEFARIFSERYKIAIENTSNTDIAFNDTLQSMYTEPPLLRSMEDMQQQAINEFNERAVAEGRPVIPSLDDVKTGKVPLPEGIKAFISADGIPVIIDERDLSVPGATPKELNLEVMEPAIEQLQKPTPFVPSPLL